MSQGTDHIEELFRSKLSNLETPVDANLWNSIQSGLNASTVATTTAKTGMSLLAKSAIIGAIAVTVGGSLFYFSNDNNVENVSVLAEDKSDYLNQNIENQKDKKTIDDRSVINSVAESKVILNSDKYVVKGSSKVERNVLVSEPFINESIVKSIVPVVESPNIVPTPDVSPSEVKEDRSILENVVENRVEATEVLSAPMFVEKTSIDILPNIYLLSNSGSFKIEYTGSFKDFSITILDGKQNAIFRSDKPDFQWNGDNVYGEKVSPGDYLYLIIAVDKDNNKIQKYQSLKVMQ